MTSILNLETLTGHISRISLQKLMTPSYSLSELMESFRSNYFQKRYETEISLAVPKFTRPWKQHPNFFITFGETNFN